MRFPGLGCHCPLAGFGECLGGGQFHVALGEDPASLLDVGSREAYAYRNPDLELGHGLDHPLGHPVTAVDAGKYVHQDGLDPIVGQDQPECFGHPVRRRPASDVEKVGWLAASVFDHVHRGHG